MLSNLYWITDTCPDCKWVGSIPGYGKEHQIAVSGRWFQSEANCSLRVPFCRRLLFYFQTAEKSLTVVINMHRGILGLKGKTNHRSIRWFTSNSVCLLQTWESSASPTLLWPVYSLSVNLLTKHAVTYMEKNKQRRAELFEGFFKCIL